MTTATTKLCNGSDAPTDNGATMCGYTHGYIARSGTREVFILVKPTANLGAHFRAWNSDDQEYQAFYGPYWTFTRTED